MRRSAATSGSDGYPPSFTDINYTGRHAPFAIGLKR